MKTIRLLRHVKSSWDDPALSDHDRPLAARGRDAALRLSAHLTSERIRVDVVLCSSATRARQTLDLVSPALNPDGEIHIEAELYTADAGDLLNRLRRLNDATKDVLIIGHNPAVEDLTHGLAGEGDPTAIKRLHRKFPTGALATVTTETTWKRLDRGLGYLESFVIPRDL